MKRIIPVFATLLFTACGLFYFSDQAERKADSLLMPSGASEENGELRREWERKRLADPATGEIPAGIQFLERQFAANLPQTIVERGGNGEWMSRGPWNVGGRTRALAIDVSNEDRLLAGGVSGGMWLSEDGGHTWARKTPLNAHPGCTSIAQDTRPGKTNTWYYTSGELYGASPSDASGLAYYLGDGLFKSTDGGNNWTAINSTDDGSPHSFTTVWQGVWRVATDPAATQDVVYAATYGAIFRSTNGGSSWTVVRGSNTAGPFSYYTDIVVTSTGVAYATLSSAGTQKGFWRSTNGTTWVNITPANMPNEYNRIVMGINPNNENEVYFFGTTPGSGHYTKYIDSDDWTSLWKYTYISGDGTGAGGQWEDRSANLPSTGTEFDQCAAQSGYDLVVKVRPGTNEVFIGGTNLWRSTDGFATPNNTTKIGGYKIGTTLPFFELYPNHHPDVHEVVFLPSDPNVMITGSDGGIHRTEDCLAPFVEWSYLNDGYVTSQFYTAIIDKNAPGDNTLLGGLQDNGNFFVNSVDPKAPWKQTVNGDGAYGAIAPNKDFYVLSIQQGRVAKVKLDADGNVQAFRRIDPVGRTKADYLFINPLVLDPHDANILYLPAGNKLFRQNELTTIPITGQWDSIAQGWTQFPDTLTTGQFSAIAVSEAAPTNRLYLGTSNNKVFRVDNANTGSPSFTALPSPDTVSADAYINCLAIDPTNADRVILVYSNYSIYSIFLSENAGASWKKIGGNLESNFAGTGAGPSLRWVSILPMDNGKRKYFCGTSVGLYSADTLKTQTASNQPATVWTLEAPTEIGTTVVDFVDNRRSDGLVVAATHGIGMFAANFMTGSGSQEPKKANAVRVWPNPAHDVAAFSIPGQSLDNTQLRLFDLKGNLLREESFSGEKGLVQLNALPAGVYVWELRGKGWRKSGKIVKE